MTQADNTISENLTMSQKYRLKCSHFNSGYCKFAKKEKGCKFYHPQTTCELPNCKDKKCPARHPRSCKFGDTCSFQTRCSYKHEKYKPSKELIENTSKEVDQLKADIAKLKNENDIKINILAKVHYNELEELKNKITTLEKDIMENLEKYKADLKLKDSEVRQAKEIIQVKETTGVESISELSKEVNNLKLEVKRQKHIIHISEVRLKSKDDELIKTHSVIDKLNQDVMLVTVKENKLKQAAERIKVLEEENIKQPHELPGEIETLKLQFENLRHKVQTTDVTLASKDNELTIAYGIIDSFKIDILTLTDQLETMKSLRHQRH